MVQCKLLEDFLSGRCEEISYCPRTVQSLDLVSVLMTSRSAELSGASPASPEHVEADEERDEEEHQAGGHAQPQRQHQAHQAAATVGAEIFYK